MKTKPKITIGGWKFPVGEATVIPEMQVKSDGGKALYYQHRLSGGVAEVLEPLGTKSKKPVLSLRLDDVFGKPKAITIGHDWIQLGERLFKESKS